MQIKEVDVRVIFYCEEDSEIYLLIDKMKELDEFRDDLFVNSTGWILDSKGKGVYCVVLEHTDGADILQLQLYKEIDNII